MLKIKKDHPETSGAVHGTIDFMFGQQRTIKFISRALASTRAEMKALLSDLKLDEEAERISGTMQSGTRTVLDLHGVVGAVDSAVSAAAPAASLSSSSTSTSTSSSFSSSSFSCSAAAAPTASEREEEEAAPVLVVHARLFCVFVGAAVLCPLVAIGLVWVWVLLLFKQKRPD